MNKVIEALVERIKKYEIEKGNLITKVRCLEPGIRNIEGFANYQKAQMCVWLCVEKIAEATQCLMLLYNAKEESHDE